jgi:hypothetical protein
MSRVVAMVALCASLAGGSIVETSAQEPLWTIAGIGGDTVSFPQADTA